LSFLLNKRNPKTLAEAHNMAIQIEKNLLSSGINAFTMDSLSLMKLVSIRPLLKIHEKERNEFSTSRMRT
jgi:hypothetical protein